MELLSPAGTPEALRAAVTGGADAVYFGADSFNARMNAGNFGKEDILASIEYCHKRGVLCHAVLNTLVSDRELASSPTGEGVLSLAEFFVSAGIDAFIIQDVGLAKILSGSTSVPLHASTQMTVHSLDGVLELADMGFSRAVLSRELSRDDLIYIRKRAPEGFELEIFGHGALCMCYSGQCYMSSIIGGRSGNRGRCAQPCRLPYEGGYRLSLKDLCLIEHLQELESIGIDSVKIEGRMKSPEYVYTVTKKYADALRGAYVSSSDIKELEDVFSRGGFTDGYYTSKTGTDMFGVKTETPDREVKKVPSGEYKRLGIDLLARTTETADGDTALRIVYTDSQGLSAEEEIPLSPALKTPLSAQSVAASLTKYGDTVYAEAKTDISVEPGFFAAVSALNGARRACFERLENMRCVRAGGFLLRKPDISGGISAPELPSLRAFFLRPENIPPAASTLSMIRIPLASFDTKVGKTAACMYGEKICAVLPQAFHDTERRGVESLIISAYDDFGIRDFAAGNLGQIRMLSDMRLGKYGDIRIHGDYGLNIYNSYSLCFYRERGLSSLVMSFEAPLAQLRAMSGADCGIIAYGRLPFMIMRNCVKSRHGKPEYLCDRKGKKFLLSCDYGCRNRLFNADILWLADKDLRGFGFNELYFTDESADCAEGVISSYLTGEGAMTEGKTRGRYFSATDASDKNR